MRMCVELVRVRACVVDVSVWSWENALPVGHHGPKGAASRTDLARLTAASLHRLIGYLLSFLVTGSEWDNTSSALTPSPLHLTLQTPSPALHNASNRAQTDPNTSLTSLRSAV